MKISASTAQLLQWIRNIGGLYCTEVRSFQEMKNGLVLAEIVAEVYSSYQIISQLNTHNLQNENNCLANLNNILCEIKSQCVKNGVGFPSHLSTLTPSILYEDSDQLQTICEWLFLQKKLLAMKNCGFPPHRVSPVQLLKTKISQASPDSEDKEKEKQSESSEPELFYASDLNDPQDDKSNIDEEATATSRVEFKSLETSYSVIRPNSPFQFGSNSSNIQKKKNSFSSEQSEAQADYKSPKISQTPLGTPYQQKYLNSSGDPQSIKIVPFTNKSSQSSFSHNMDEDFIIVSKKNIPLPPKSNKLQKYQDLSPKSNNQSKNSHSSVVSPSKNNNVIQFDIQPDVSRVSIGSLSNSFSLSASKAALKQDIQKLDKFIREEKHLNDVQQNKKNTFCQNSGMNLTSMGDSSTRSERPPQPHFQNNSGGKPANQLKNQEIDSSKQNQQLKPSYSNSEFMKNDNENQNRVRSVSQQQDALSQRCQELSIIKCGDQEKERCLKWLYDICLIKKDIKDIKEKLPKVCKNGVIFLDIINRVNGKSDTINGINRCSKNEAQIRANYSKLFEHLRSFEKMNPRYLFRSEEYLILGNSDIFWGLLDDLWHFFHNKISPFDTRVSQNQLIPPKEYVTVYKNPKTLYQEPSLQQNRSYQDVLLFPKDKTECSNNSQTRFIHSQTGYYDGKIGKQLPQKELLNQMSSQSLLNQKSSAISGQDNLKDNQVIQDCKNETEWANQITSSFPNKESQKTSYAISSNQLHNYKDMHSQRQQQAVYAQQTPRMRSLSRMSSRDNLGNDNSSMKQCGGYPNNRFDLNNSFQGQQLINRSFNMMSSSPSSNRKNSASRIMQITVEMEMQTNSFLNRLGFREYLVKKDRQLFEDPLRNGTLLCKLVEALNQSISLIIYNPRNIHDCRANIENALSSLRAICTETSIPLFLLHKGEDILKGDHDTIWSLLYTLMKNENTIKSSKHDKTIQSKRIPSTAHSNREDESHRNQHIETNNYLINKNSHFNYEVFIPYSTDQIIQLEESLLLWLNYILKSQYPNFATVKSSIRKGLLLSEIVSILLAREIMPTHLNPSSEQSCLANIQKALQLLRSNNKFGQRFLWKENLLLSSNHSVIIGLLEDLRRFSDGLPARKGEDYFAEGPYFGPQNGINGAHPFINGVEKKSLSLSDQQKNKQQSHSSKNPKQDLYAMKVISQIPPTHSKLPQSSPSQTQNNLFHRRNQSLETKLQSSASSATLVSTKIPQPNIENQSPFALHLLHWLNDIGLSNISSNLDLSLSHVSSFKDGIIEKLDQISIPGLIQNPKTSASCLVNIRKAFYILKKKSEFDQKFLLDETLVYEAKQPFVVAFLSAMKNTFRNQSRYLQRLKKNEIKS